MLKSTILLSKENISDQIWSSQGYGLDPEALVGVCWCGVGAGQGDGPMPNLFSIIYFTCGATRRGLGPDRGINVNWDLS